MEPGVEFRVSGILETDVLVNIELEMMDCKLLLSKEISPMWEFPAVQEVSKRTGIIFSNFFLFSSLLFFFEIPLLKVIFDDELETRSLQVQLNLRIFDRVSQNPGIQ